MILSIWIETLILIGVLGPWKQHWTSYLWVKALLLLGMLFHISLRGCAWMSTKIRINIGLTTHTNSLICSFKSIAGFWEKNRKAIWPTRLSLETVGIDYCPIKEWIATSKKQPHNREWNWCLSYLHSGLRTLYTKYKIEITARGNEIRNRGPPKGLGYYLQEWTTALPNQPQNTGWNSVNSTRN